MPIFASIKVSSVQFDPQPATTVPVGSLFIDSSNSQVTTKPVDNSPPSSIQSPVDYFIKSVITGAAFANKTTVARDSVTGKVVAADADVNAATNIGYAMSASSGPNQTISIFLIGPNLSDHLLGLGFNTGDRVYLDKNAGQLVKDISGFISSDAIVFLGIADCANGVASTTATDLISTKQDLSL